MDVDGFAVRPDGPAARSARRLAADRSDRLVHDERRADPRRATIGHSSTCADRLIPDLSIRSIAVLGGLGVALVYLFRPGGRRCCIDSRMFFLGAAFMLLETKAVVQLALLFGSTWLVNSLVFFTVLVMVLSPTCTCSRCRPVELGWHYAGCWCLSRSA